MEPLPKKSLKCPNCGANVADDGVSCPYCHSVLNIAACPSCFGPVFKGMKFCPNCGAAVDRNEVESKQKLPCPRCEKILSPADIAGTRIHECINCGGIWLDTASFQKISSDREHQEKVILYPSQASSIEPKPDQQPRRVYVPCPECGELMNQKNFAGCSGIVIDLCKPHGIWFDHLELQRIVNFIKEGGLHKSRENELANLKMEQRRLQEIQQNQSLESLDLSDHSLIDLYDDGSLIDDIFSALKKFFQD